MRPTRDKTLMAVAHLFEERSTCDRNQVGAVISLHGRILSTGYNGTPSAMDHCSHHQDEASAAWPIRISRVPRLSEGASFNNGCKEAVHAEANAIAFAARYGLTIVSAEIHTTLSPCYSCAQLIINAGLIKVTYSRTYRDPSGIDLLERAGIAVEFME
jgi:dCMP deaminase